MAPAAYQAMRGVNFLAATTLVAEVGDLRRFDSPAQLMSFLGLVPSEHSTGDTTRRGAITAERAAELREILAESLAGHVTRRDVLKRASALGLSAPVGHTPMHWPQNTHGDSVIGIWKLVETRVSKPRSASVSAKVYCASSAQTCTQRQHKTHWL